MTAAKTYMLLLTYHDPCGQDTVRIMTHTAGHISAEIRNTGTYADHWNRRRDARQLCCHSRHATLDGPFPFPESLSLFPSRSFVQGTISTMAIGQRKYLFQLREGDAAYTATVQRVG